MVNDAAFRRRRRHRTRLVTSVGVLASFAALAIAAPRATNDEVPATSPVAGQESATPVPTAPGGAGLPLEAAPLKVASQRQSSAARAALGSDGVLAAAWSLADARGIVHLIRHPSRAGGLPATWCITVHRPQRTSDARYAEGCVDRAAFERDGLELWAEDLHLAVDPSRRLSAKLRAR
jgi:hypothetical protein